MNSVQGTPEHAQLVWARSGTLAGRVDGYDLGETAIELFRAAGNDQSTLRHALGLGRSRLRREPGDRAATRGVRLLEDVIAFLGVRRRPGEVGQPSGFSVSRSRARDHG
jgi:hypothetical protein